MRVFVTGHRGYIGAHLVDVLRAAGHEITGCDLELFADCAWREPVAPDRELACEFRACSVYGKGEKLDLDEGDPMHPLTAYARSKVDTEGALFALADDTSASLRNATANGDAPMLRIDLVANDLLASALAPAGQMERLRSGAAT